MAIEFGYEQILDAMRVGRMSPLKCLAWAVKYSLSKSVLDIRPLLEVAQEALPQVTWHVGDEQESGVVGVLPFTWHGPADFLEWADKKLGRVISLGSYLHQLAQADNPELAQRVKDAAQSEFKARRAERIEKSKRLVEEEGLSLRAAAKKLGVHHDTVREDLVSEKPGRPEKSDTPRLVIRYEMKAGTNPATAAARIRERFGDAFAAALKEAL